MPTVSPSSQRPSPPKGFANEIRSLVRATAPRLFAVVETYEVDDGVYDARVAAWGLTHEDGDTQVTSTDGSFRMSLRTPDRAAELISRRPGSEGIIVWTDHGNTGEHSPN